MNPVESFFTKVFIYFWYKKDKYFFWRSKKYIKKWGEGTYGQPYVMSYDKRSTLDVGSYCSIASNVNILLGANHLLGRVTTYPLNLIDSTSTVTDASEPGSIVIGNDVWIGFGVTIVGPVFIGDGAVVGAGALVVDDVPPYSIVGGVPAKVIKYRVAENQIKDMISIAWWNWGKEKIKKSKEDIYSNDFTSFINKYKIIN